MKKIVLGLVVLVITMVLICSCEQPPNTSDTSHVSDNSNVEDDNIPGNDNKFLSLKIVSKYSGYIYRVGLVGYSFDDLRILENESKTFELVNGISGGNENVNVSVSFRPDSKHIDPRNPLQIKCNFTIGRTTVITLPQTGNLIVSYE